jgi:hypothetical protein
VVLAAGSVLLAAFFFTAAVACKCIHGNREQKGQTHEGRRDLFHDDSPIVVKSLARGKYTLLFAAATSGRQEE